MPESPDNVQYILEEEYCFHAFNRCKSIKDISTGFEYVDDIVDDILY